MKARQLFTTYRLPLAAVSASALATLAGLAMQHPPSQAASSSELGSESRCARYSGLPDDFGKQRLSGMIEVAGGTFTPGTLQGHPDERPNGPVRVGSFWIDRTEVTNAQFRAFVQATGHVTQAEREGAAAVFKAPSSSSGSRHPASWWFWTPGADWRHPEGPGSDLRGRDAQPVIHVTHADAMAYAAWLGRDLPTEAEWEYAARAGGAGELIERGEPRDGKGVPTANYWQGIFPSVNTREDGHVALAPVGCYAANGWGLHDMIGNAWELTRDRYTGIRQPHNNGAPETAQGRPAAAAPPAPERLVIKGGSFLCSEDYCIRYRVTAREAQDADLGTSHVGFRTIVRNS